MKTKTKVPTYPHTIVARYRDKSAGTSEFFEHEGQTYFVIKTHNPVTSVSSIDIFGPLTEESEFQLLQDQFNHTEEG